MRVISDALRAELVSTTPRIARLLKITLTNGAIHTFTDSDVGFTMPDDGLWYEPAPGLTSISYTATADTEVSTQKIGAGWVVDAPQQDMADGVFDNAEIQAAWACWANTAAGRMITFQGALGQLTYDQNGFSAEVNSFMKQLEKNIGWTYTANCRHALYSGPRTGYIGHCGVDPSSYTFAGAVASVTTQKWTFVVSGALLGKGPGYFSGGNITFTSGLNTSLSAVVKTHAVSPDSTETFSLFLPTAFTFPAGTTFTVQAGCDKTISTCINKFNNVLNHGGFPTINSNVQYR